MRIRVSVVLACGRASECGVGVGGVGPGDEVTEETRNYVTCVRACVRARDHYHRFTTLLSSLHLRNSSSYTRLRTEEEQGRLRWGEGEGSTNTVTKHGCARIHWWPVEKSWKHERKPVHTSEGHATSSVNCFWHASAYIVQEEVLL